MEKPSDEENEQVPIRSKSRAGTINEGPTDIKAPTAAILLEKIAHLESQLSRLTDIVDFRHGDVRVPTADSLPTDSHISHKDDTWCVRCRRGGLSQSDVPRDESVSEPDFGDPMSCFRVLGETSINQTLQQVENILESPGSDKPVFDKPVQAKTTPPCSTSLTVAIDSAPMPDVLMDKLRRHDLKPSKEDWDQLYDNYCEFVFPLFPFLHLPSLQKAYAQLWNSLGQGSWAAQAAPPSTVDDVAQVLICLALGRCTTSVRAQATEATHSAGWKLYSAAVDLLGNLVDPMGEGSPRVFRLQSLALMVVYLIRLDANELAQKILAVAIVQAQQLGLHREKTLQHMPIFLSEAARRVWHIIYILDRRLALDVGRPFLIQDHNIDSKLPLNISDDWLEEHWSSQVPMESMADEMMRHSADDRNTPIGYVDAMVGYSQMVGKIWDTLYQANAPDSGCTSSFSETFEVRISTWYNSLPLSLRCDDDKPHLFPAGLTPWQIRQRVLVYVRTKWIQILVRKPLRQPSMTADWRQDFENLSKSIELAESILDLFSRVLEPYQMYQFPFLQYLLGAASIMLGILIKVPGFVRRCGDSIARAAHLIRIFCRKTWISGKMARSVTRFTSVAARIVENVAPRETAPETSRPQPQQASDPTRTKSPSRTGGSSLDATYSMGASSNTNVGNGFSPGRPATTLARSSGRADVALDHHDGYEWSHGQAFVTDTNSLSFGDDTAMWQLVTSDFAFETGITTDVDYYHFRPRESGQNGSTVANRDAFGGTGIGYDAGALFDMSSTF